ncbi:MAG TPA: serine hydrolase domain-containing protein [Duganella sp.]|nr:serine hydrolase domain-containing protein [Duganella sp.]
MHSSPTLFPAGIATLPALVDRAIDRALGEQRLVGAMVLVAQHGRIIHRRAAGWADREARVAVRDNTLFRLASVSKPIVSAAAMVLADRGKLPLDASVRRWLPDFAPRLGDGGIPDITVRHLLTHTAGLGYRFLESGADGPYARAGVSDGMDDADITLSENLRRLASTPLLYQPGTAWGYSLATDVLGGVIEQACGMALGEAVKALVTEPLGMRDTDFTAADPGRLAVAYVDNNDHNGVNHSAGPRPLAERDVVSPFEGAVGIRYSPRRALDPGAFPSGGAGMVGSAEDLLRLLEALRGGGGAIVSRQTAARMGANHTGALELPNAPGFGFGLGFSVLVDPAKAASPESPGTWRWGGAYGHSWFVDPARGLSVVAFTNTMYEGMSGRFVGALRDAVYQGLAGHPHG